MPLLLQRYTRFTGNVIYLGADMANKKLNKKTMKLNSKGRKSQRKANHMEDLPYELRGLPNNRWGGHKTNKLRGFRGSTYGPASKGTKFTQEQLEAYAEKHGLQVWERRG
jgi:hypothetical protein